MYTLTNTTSIKRDSDGAMIPADPKNRDFQEYLAWVAGGGIPTPLPSKTIQEQRDAISNAIQSMLDEKARSFRYDSIMSARSYSGYVNPFQAEAIKLASWSSSCWSTAGNIEAQVNAGTIPMPTVEQALAMMPMYI